MERKTPLSGVTAELALSASEAVGYQGDNDCPLWRLWLTFDMSGGFVLAQPAQRRPLDGWVGRHLMRRLSQCCRANAKTLEAISATTSAGK